MALTLFVSAVFFILYTYAVYPVILLVLHSVSPRRTVPDGSKDLSVSIVIAAYNEEAVLRNKIDNLLRLQLDRGRSEILIGSDGSTDGTNEILRLIDDSAIRSKCFATRRGKAAILNDLVSESSGEVIVFSDANTMYDANTVRHLIRHFSDPRVGAVCGELIFTSKSKTVNSMAEGAYWSLENRLKKMESDISTTITATGAVYAIRKELFVPLPTSRVITDDILTPMNILRQGYVVRYEPEALAYEVGSTSIGNEFRRKTRISAGNFNGLRDVADILRPRYGFASFAFWSHKIIRWCVPFLLLIIFASSILLRTESIFFTLFFWCEVGFMGAALAGMIAEKVKFRIGILGLPYYFLAMNSALLVGFLQFVFNTQRPTWTVVRHDE